MNQLAQRNFNHFLWLIAEGVIIWATFGFLLFIFFTKTVARVDKIVVGVVVTVLLVYIIRQTPMKLRELLRS